MSANERPRRDWRISAILLAIWVAAVLWIRSSRLGVPDSMLLIASVFFVFLIPAMTDLVGTLERAFSRAAKGHSAPDE